MLLTYNIEQFQIVDEPGIGWDNWRSTSSSKRVVWVQGKNDPLPDCHCADPKLKPFNNFSCK